MDHKIELMEQAQKSAVGPEILPNEILRSIGCCALRDLGGMAWVSCHMSCLAEDMHIMISLSCTDSAVSSLPGYSYWHVFHPIQLFHGDLHGGSTLFERLQGAQQKQKGQEYIIGKRYE